MIGEESDFVMADLERTIEDALTSDDRIESISDFEIEQADKQTITCKFTVNTIAGAYAEVVEVTT